MEVGNGGVVVAIIVADGVGSDGAIGGIVGSLDKAEHKWQTGWFVGCSKSTSWETASASRLGS